MNTTIMGRFSTILVGSMPQRLCQLNRKVHSPPCWNQFHSKRFLFSKTIVVEKFYSNTPFFNKHCVHFCSLREETENILEVEIISKEFVKPATPTPQHLRMHEVSLIDQLFPHIYMPIIYFYPNNQNNKNLTSEKRRILKQSLSKTLTKFYPLAGRFKDHRHIDCNDDGIYYVEAKVDYGLSDFLKQPDDKSMSRLLPVDPNTVQSLVKKHLAMVQVTEFGCGGIAIGTYMEHKIMDGYSIATFLNAWSATARACSKEINPSFIASLIFPSNPTVSEDVTSMAFPLFAQSKTATRRFLFPSSSLGTLKKKLNASRVLAVSGLIWKCATAASKARSKAMNCIPGTSSLTVTVNIREKVSPPFPPYSIGNIFATTTPIQCSGDEELGLSSIVQHLKDSTSKFTGEFLRQRTEFRLANTEAALNMLHMPYCDKNAKHMLISSICRIGMYEADFGWGKPVWVRAGNGFSDFPIIENFVLLMDTRCGNGIEAWVTLGEEDMNIFEQDPELLAFASLNACPLESVE